MYRGDNQIRHVYLNVPHSVNPTPSWNGESVGYYEGGDTLVVDTIGVLVHPYNFVDNYRTPHTDQLHVVERYRISPDGQEPPQVAQPTCRRFSKATCQSVACRCASASFPWFSSFAVASRDRAYPFCVSPVTRDTAMLCHLYAST